MSRAKVNLSPKYDAISGQVYEHSISFGAGKKQHKRKKLWSGFKKTLIYSMVSIVGVAGFFIAFNWPLISSQISYALASDGNTEQPLSHQEQVEVLEQAADAPAGEIINIPKIAIQAPVVYQPSVVEADVQSSLQTGVVHFGGTAKPGDPGNVVIVGHSSNDPWAAGEYNYIFALLEKLEIGDNIEINHNSKKYVYQVSEEKIVEPTDISVIQPTADPTLTLITCWPLGTNWQRLIIHAKQVSPDPVPQQIIVETPSVEQKVSLPGTDNNLSSKFIQWVIKALPI
ncbi:sortase [Candidatus Saccharibacteria bacterium]|nr:sortase [Candidatus Saccharibacteria bacterium]MCB9834836.1 sortase [Candidatus Nomurabacteria bacterium]